MPCVFVGGGGCGVRILSRAQMKHNRLEQPWQWIHNEYYPMWIFREFNLELNNFTA